jgi:alpha-L-arabinofuranosidase
MAAKHFALAFLMCGLVCGASSRAAGGAPALELKVQAEKTGPRINPAMWGIFFEDINFGADGGLYAELIKNRAFEFPDALMGWSQVNGYSGNGTVEVLSKEPSDPRSPHYLRVTSEGRVPFGVANEGFRGMGFKQSETYDFAVQMRCLSGSPTVVVQLVAADGRILTSTSFKKLPAEWAKRTARLRPSGTDGKGRLNLLVIGEGVVDFDLLSLFPQHTWKNRPGGLRADLVQMLADLQPGFMRFPGGCIVEGRYLTNRYQWKTTLGALEDRTMIINRWNDEFKHRPAPDYFQSFGLGFYEFFQLCEDIGTEPLPILNCGMACQFNSGELAPLDQLEPYIQDALDLIEFANGPADSAWGSRRAAMGHPAPFHLKLLGIGNEQWGPQYFERYERFARTLKAKAPGVSLVSSAGPSPADDRFQFAWEKLRALNADIVDEHCYDLPAWFLKNAGRYDNYPRRGPRVFMGEYAAQSVGVVSTNNHNNLECALAEAAFMTGLERNADVVCMASYAPLFAHRDAWQWTPDLIWCDNLQVFGTPSYYVQKLFSRNRSDVVLRAELLGAAATTLPPLYATASLDVAAGEIILKVVNPGAQTVVPKVRIAGLGDKPAQARMIVLAGRSPAEENSFDTPAKIVPVEQPVVGVRGEFLFPFKPYSLTILRIVTPNP